MSDLTNWPTSAETAQRLRISERALYREKRIEWKHRQVPGRKPERVYNPDDLEALLAILNPPHVMSPIVPPSARSGASVKIQNSGNGQALAILEALSRIPRRTAPRLFLTIPEASEYSGLSETCLKRLVRDGKLAAVRDGGYKIRRTDLEHFATHSAIGAIGGTRPRQLEAAGEIGPTYINGVAADVI